MHDQGGVPMAYQRLKAIDTAFLQLESPIAHMHVGWAAIFDPPEDGKRHSFDEIREQIERRLSRAPRYRQRLAFTPLNLADPVWVDDKDFAIENHVRRVPSKGVVSRKRFNEIVGEVLSTPLARNRPLWTLDVVESLAGRRTGVIGKVHHCMVDGLAAVELGTLLMDTDPDAPRAEPDRWEPRKPPSAPALLGLGIADRLREPFRLARMAAGTATSPGRMRNIAVQLLRTPTTLVRELTPLAPASPLNPPIGSARQLATVARPLEELKQIRRAFGTTVNDVMLAVAAGATRALLESRGSPLLNLKAMVPVALRSRDEATELGNRISFMFIELPIEEPDPKRRLLDLAMETQDRKRRHDPETSDYLLRALYHSPHPLHPTFARMAADRRVFNLVVSNIPGPRIPLYSLGARLREVYPVVPLPDRHAVSIGITTNVETACYGIYADPQAVPDLNLLTAGLNEAIDELLAAAAREQEEQEESVART